MRDKIFYLCSKEFVEQSVKSFYCSRESQSRIFFTLDVVTKTFEMIKLSLANMKST